MQDVGDYGFRHGKLCAGQSGGMYQNTQWIYIVRNDAGHSISYCHYLPFLQKKEHSFKKHFPLPLHFLPLRLLLLHKILVMILCS